MSTNAPPPTPSPTPGPMENLPPVRVPATPNPEVKIGAGAAAAASPTPPAPATPAATPTPTPAAATPAPTPPDPAIEALNLSPTAKAAAYALKKQYPSIVFNSGRRGTKEEQASAMAENVVQNRQFIAQTYAQNAAREQCQKWVNEHPEAKTKAQIQAGLLSILNGLSESQLAEAYKHMSGDAFDVQPVEKDAEKIKDAIRDLPGCKKFLDQEGGLVRWHAQF
jgi:hypothetical protein